MLLYPLEDMRDLWDVIHSLDNFITSPPGVVGFIHLWEVWNLRDVKHSLNIFLTILSDAVGVGDIFVKSLLKKSLGGRVRNFGESLFFLNDLNYLIKLTFGNFHKNYMHSEQKRVKIAKIKCLAK